MNVDFDSVTERTDGPTDERESRERVVYHIKLGCWKQWTPVTPDA